MKSGRFFSSLMLAGLCLWTLNTTAAESQSIELRVGARDGEADQRELYELKSRLIQLNVDIGGSV